MPLDPMTELAAYDPFRQWVMGYQPGGSGSLGQIAAMGQQFAPQPQIAQLQNADPFLQMIRNYQPPPPPPPPPAAPITTPQLNAQGYWTGIGPAPETPEQGKINRPISELQLKSGYTTETPGQEATRLTGEYAAGQAAAHPSGAYANTISPLSRAGLQVYGPVLRPFVGDAAQQQAQVLAQAEEAVDPSEFGHQARGVISSGAQMAANTGIAHLTKTGTAGVAVLNGIQQADQSLTEARHAGFGEKAAVGHAVAMGAIETGITLLANKYLPTGEKLGLSTLKGDLLKGGFKTALVDVLKSVVGENAEELATNFLQKYVEKLDGVDRKEWTLQEAGDLFKDTVIQTTATVGLFGGGKIGTVGYQQMQRAARYATVQAVQAGRRGQQQVAATWQQQANQQAAVGATEASARAHEFLSGLTPEALQQLALVRDPSRSNIARAVGIDRNQVGGSVEYRQMLVDGAKKLAPPPAPKPIPGVTGNPAQPAPQAPAPQAPGGLNFENPNQPGGGEAFQPGQGQVGEAQTPAKWDAGLEQKHRLRGLIAEVAKEKNLDPAIVRHYAEGEITQEIEDFKLRQSVWDAFRHGDPIPVRNQRGEVISYRRGYWIDKYIKDLRNNDESNIPDFNNTVDELLNNNPSIPGDTREQKIEAVKDILKEGKPTQQRIKDAVEKAAGLAQDHQEHQEWLKAQGKSQQPADDNTPFSPMGSPEAGVLQTMRQIEPGADRGALVSIRDLRRAMPHMSKRDFDDKIIRMAQGGALAPHRHDFASSLTPDEREQLVFNPDDKTMGDKGSYYVGVAMRQQPVGSPQEAAQGNLFPSPPKPHVPTGANPRVAGIDAIPQSTVQGTGVPPIALEEVGKAQHKVGEILAGRRASIRSGRLTSNNAVGQYFPWSGAMRIGTAGDLRTQGHEIGHFHEMNSEILKGITPPMEAELINLGHAHYQGRKPRGASWTQEGYSEWMYQFLNNPDVARKNAPKFSAYAEPKLNAVPGAAKAIAHAQERNEYWFRKMGAPERTRAQQVDPYSFSERIKRGFANVRKFLSLQNLNDTISPMGTVVREAEQLLGRKLRPSENPHRVLLAHRGRATGITQRFTLEGQYLPDQPDVKIGPSLAEIYAPIKSDGDYEKANDFQYALFALESWQHDLDPGISRDDAAATVRQLDSPLLRKVAAEVQEWNRNFNRYISAYDPTIAQGLSAAEQKYGFYLPAKRDMPESELRGTRGGQAGAGGAKSGRISATRKGGGQRVKEQLPQLIADKYALLKRAMQRQATETLLKLIYKLDARGKPLAAFSHWIEETTDKPYNAADFRWTQQTGGQKTVRTFAIQPELQKLLDSIEPAQLTGAARVLFGIPTQFAKFGWMAASPRYGLIRNPMRDLPEMLIKAPGDISLGRRLMMVPHYFENWGRSLVGRDNAWMETAKQLGLESTQMLSEHTANPTTVMRQIGKGLTWHEPRTWLDGMLKVYGKAVEKVQSAEMAARVETMRVKAEQMGWQPGQALDMDTAIELAIAFKQPMGDYGAKGELFRTLDQIFPLASVPITYGRSFGQALYRDGKFNKTGIAIGFASLTIPTFALWLRNKDEEWYRNLPPQEKYSRLYLADNDSNTGLLWYRNSEAGMVFSAIPEALIDGVYASFAAKGDRQGMERVTDLVKYLVEQATPSAPPLVKEAAEQFANKQVQGGQIVPEREGIIKRAPAEQFTEQTSETAKAIGRATGLSPLRLEHGANTLTGGVSKRLTDLESTLGVKQATREQQLSDLPLVGGVFPSGGLTGNRPKPIEELYRLQEHLQQRQHSVEQPETDAERSRRLTVEAAARAISALSAERAHTPGAADRQELMNKAARLAEEAMSEAGGDKQVFAGTAEAARYRAEQDSAKRYKMLYNRLDALTHEKPMIGHAGVTRANLSTRRQAYSDVQEAAKTFLQESGVKPEEALAFYREAVVKGVGPEREGRIASAETRVGKLRRLKLALGL